MKANTSNSYSVYLRRPVTVLVKVFPSLISPVLADAAEPFFLYNSLNPLMIPFLESTGGSCQDAWMLVEVCAATAKLVGACEGAGIDQ